MLIVPEEHVDVGLWALIIAREHDSAVDPEGYLVQLDSMAAEVRRMLVGRDTDLDKLAAVKTYLYEAGPWNDHRPFGYDLADPLGEESGARLLSTYLDTRLGNCVSMPTLFHALMERVDPNVPLYGATAPKHLMLRFHDRRSGDVWNIETTNEARALKNRFYVDKMGASQRAIEQGAYLRDMTKREYVGELIGALSSQARKAEDYWQALEWAKLMAELHPRSIPAWVQQGALQSQIAYDIAVAAQAQGGWEYPGQEAALRGIQMATEAAIGRAFELGWVPEKPEDEAAYLELVRAEQERRKRTDEERSD